MLLYFNSDRYYNFQFLSSFCCTLLCHVSHKCFHVALIRFLCHVVVSFLLFFSSKITLLSLAFVCVNFLFACDFFGLHLATELFVPCSAVAPANWQQCYCIVQIKPEQMRTVQAVSLTVSKSLLQGLVRKVRDKLGNMEELALNSAFVEQLRSFAQSPKHNMLYNI